MSSGFRRVSLLVLLGEGGAMAFIGGLIGHVVYGLVVALVYGLLIG